MAPTSLWSSARITAQTGTARRRRAARRSAVPILIALAAVALLAAGCGGDDDAANGESSTAPGVAAATTALEQDAVVIDVRTPEEYDAGHVADAQLIDIQAPGFTEAIEALDPEQNYVVYCRSGNRSAVAAEQMTAIGLDVLDGGGLDDMVAGGWTTA
jgi:rhodanese-related sulfurtransferase